ncbi:pleckstrin homology domain-containing family A member 8 isoform X1 [Seriola lalandi dorsalis]|uniref:pleckstrin homology domain-containing family A member 8 isoform X1 n=1 Tax=Seriola lalandi dorsalis TaxID=1841481 RepID=UPI000C6FA86F|nr:pleckstrin homology domain-containing family A member 8 isoform X1 [Seriola lalandi dorsalis]XP_056237088.1 pleckstrin homology domain-containing family A member 8 isoform X1 [Seriola aureovittata]
MEGMLYKWTNYISGWQPRWFVLDGGTLSYYDSQEDAWKGCKGSIKISVCEIQVHSSDSTRVDLTIPGEQYFYLKAINAAERQKWLVALGTAKACLTDNRTKREKELQENTEALKTKMSELRLYCDLLLQQVNKIKENDELGDSAETGIDTGNMVKSTCTTFLKTLEECMQIANRTFSSDMATQSPPGSPPVAAIKPQKQVKPVNHLNQNLGEKWRDLAETTGEIAHDNQSLDSGAEGPEESDRPEHHPSPSDIEASDGNGSVHEEQVDPTPHTTQNSSDTEHYDQPPEGAEENEDDEKETKQEQEHKVDQSQEHDNNNKEVNAVQPQHQQETVTDQDEGQHEGETSRDSTETEDTEQVETFFSTMSHRFSDIRLDDDNGIPTQEFLDSCYAIVPVLDKLGSTVFAPVKMDFVGNIKKIHQKLMSDPDSFPTLQSIVLHEIHTDVAQVRNSATEALLWLRRGLKFLKEFLSEVNAGQQDIHGALNNAYGKTLRQYHGWVVRGVFALALRAAPSYQSFTAALVSREGDELKSGFSSGMHRDLGMYLPAMEKQLAILDALYEEYNLESDEVV